MAVLDLGLVEYSRAWELQTVLNKRLIDAKREGGQKAAEHEHYLILCEHPPVYTLGKSGTEDNVLIDEQRMKQLGIEFFRINRGGDITFHGPGQLVCYPIFDLDRFFTDVHRYVRSLEEVVIRLLDIYGLTGQRLPEYTGVWLNPQPGVWRKVCAIGVHLSRWVTMHGLALNVCTEMDYFRHIVPCGISPLEKEVTSISRELGRAVTVSEVSSQIRTIFAEVFGYEPVNQQDLDLN